ncbi:MAG: response regulator transcription factor [Lachnospiraceae bacterium]|nr:response regulator transcription factor [Lachnospiraceae bacterium]
MRIIVVDDDTLVSISLKTILEAKGDIEVVGIANDGSEAVKLYDELKPDIVLMDIQMKEMDGLTAADIIIQKDKDAKILLLTTFSDDEYVVKSLSVGAKGYILKQDFEGIVPAINAVMNGQSVFCGEIVNKIPKLMTQEHKKDMSQYGITDKEIEIIELVSKGMSNKEIASELYLSEGTVRNYLSIILEKLNLRDRTQLVVFYLSGSVSVDRKTE